MKLFSILVIIIMAYSCNIENTKTTKTVEKDSIKITTQEKKHEQPAKKNFVSTLDTIILDTLFYKGRTAIIKNISDSLYTDLYYKAKPITKKTYTDYDHIHYNKRKEFEAPKIAKDSSWVHRENDTLTLKIKSGNKRLINRKFENEPWNSFHYFEKLDRMNCYVVCETGYKTILHLVSEKTGDILNIGENIFTSSEFEKLITNHFYLNELDGGWFNYFSIIEKNDSLGCVETFSIDFPVDYRNNYRTWAIKDPIWITEKRIVFKYVVAQVNLPTPKVKQQHFFAEMILE